jgi:hypothetical protein
VKGPDNKVGFEFAPKVAKIPTKPPKAAKAAAATAAEDAPVKAKAAPRARTTASK